MVDYAQLRNLDTAKLTTAADAAGGLSGQMTARGGEVATASQIPGGMWAGADATAASGMMSPLSNPLYDVSDSADRSQGAMQDLVAELNKAKAKLDDAQDLVGATGITISADGTVTTPVVDDPGKAAENDRIAKQIRDVIDQAIQMANNADDVAVGSLASAGEGLAKFLGMPTNSPLGPAAWAPWAASQGIGRFGNLASFMANSQLGRFAPQGIMPNGRNGFLSPSNMTAWERARAGAAGQFRATAGNSASRAGWLKAGKIAGRAGGVLGGITSGADQLAKDWNNPNMSNVEKGGRAAYTGAVKGGAAYAGGVAGAQIGAGIGTLIAPGVGTVVGGAVGGLVGGFVGSEAGGWVVDHTVDGVGNAVDAVGDGLGKAASGVGDAVDKITPW